MPNSSIPPTIDSSVASIARAYDCFLGGKDNVEADRVVYRNVRDIAPEASFLAVAGQRFSSRAVTYPAEATISMFVTTVRWHGEERTAVPQPKCG